MGMLERGASTALCGSEAGIPSVLVDIRLFLYSFFIYHTLAGWGVKRNPRNRGM
jgi:hypothetical protein